MIHTYSFPTNMQFGAGAIRLLPDYLKEQSITSPLVVTDPNVAELDFLKSIVQGLLQKGFRAAIFKDISKNPVGTDVLSGVDAYQAHKNDAIIGIGGGAAIDVARAIALKINHPDRDLFDFDELTGGTQYVHAPIPPFIAVPTTSGTGSEVGRSAIIADKNGKKHILFHPTLMAQVAFLDPELTYSLPPHITAATGMDALTHNLEAFLAKGYHPMAEAIALEGIRLICQSIERAAQQPDETSRQDMMMASMMGAVAFQKGLGVVHSLAHPLSSLLDTHHGLANAICLPYGMEFNILGSEARFERIAQAMGLVEKTGEAVVEALINLNERLELPTGLQAVGARAEHLDKLTELAWQDFCYPSNPRPLTPEAFRELYIKLGVRN